MKNQVRRSSINWGKGFCHLLLLAFVFVLTPAVPSFVQPVRIQPMLSNLAETNPDSMVSVIVQKTVSDSRVEDAVARLGGAVTQDLSIINAFAAELQAKDTVKIAQISGVKWVSFDAPVVKSGGPDGTISTTALLNVYNKAIGADKLWAEGYQGSSVTVVVVDSGWAGHEDFRATPSGGNMRLVTRVGFNGWETNLDDHMAHGAHVAGIIGGNGRTSKGKYIGVAPKVNLISVKVSDSIGMSNTSGVIAGLQWIYDNRNTYNIRVVNLSLNSTINESYLTNPLDAALEILWFNKIVVVVSAGNNGSATLFPPANDPFVITVGAVDDKGTVSINDDVVASFSAYGTTVNGFTKPDLVAPGKNIVAPLASGGAELPSKYPANRVDGKTDYFRMSGTSMSAPIVSGAVALLIQSNPALTPDQIKYRLKATATKNWAGYTATKAGAGYLDLYAAVKGTTTASANTGVRASDRLFTGLNKPAWGSVDWGSVDWGSVDWGSVDWGSVDWGSVDWGSDYWGP